MLARLTHADATASQTLTCSCPGTLQVLFQNHLARCAHQAHQTYVMSKYVTALATGQLCRSRLVSIYCCIFMASSDNGSPGLQFNCSIKRSTRKKYRLIFDSDDENSPPTSTVCSTRANFQHKDHYNCPKQSSPLKQLQSCSQQQGLFLSDLSYLSPASTARKCCVRSDRSPVPDVSMQNGDPRLPAMDSTAKSNDLLCTPATPQSAVFLSLQDPYTPWLRTTGKPGRAWETNAHIQLAYDEEASLLSLSSGSSILTAPKLPEDLGLHECFAAAEYAVSETSVSEGRQSTWLQNAHSHQNCCDAAHAAVDVHERLATACTADAQICGTMIGLKAEENSGTSMAASQGLGRGVSDASCPRGQEPSDISIAADNVTCLALSFDLVSDKSAHSPMHQAASTTMSSSRVCEESRNNNHQYDSVETGISNKEKSGLHNFGDRSALTIDPVTVVRPATAPDVGNHSIGTDIVGYTCDVELLDMQLQAACAQEFYAAQPLMHVDNEACQASSHDDIGPKPAANESAAVEADSQAPGSAAAVSAVETQENSCGPQHMHEQELGCFQSARVTTPGALHCNLQPPCTPCGSISMHGLSIIEPQQQASGPLEAVGRNQAAAEVVVHGNSNSEDQSDDEAAADIPLTFSRRKTSKPAWRTHRGSDYSSSATGSDSACDDHDNVRDGLDKSDEFSFSLLRDIPMSTSRRDSNVRNFQAYAGRITPGNSSSLVAKRCRGKQQQQRQQQQEQQQEAEGLLLTPLHQQQQQPIGLWWEQSGSKGSTEQTDGTDPYNFDAFVPVSTPPATVGGCLMTPGAIISSAAPSQGITQMTPATTGPSAGAPVSPVQQLSCAAVIPTPATMADSKGRRKHHAPAGSMTAPAKAAQSSRQFARQRQQLAQQLYEEWNNQVFNGGLPPQLPLVWNPRLTSTAGQVVDDGSQNRLKASREERIPVRLELSTKVLDTEARLRTTLGHEMCHVAAWAISHEYKQHHGPAFWSWARRFEERVPGIKISTCHNYEIHAPFRWQCMNLECGKLYHRHKRSIDPNKHVCSRCNGRLTYLGKFSRDGKLLGSKSEQTPAAANGTPGGNIFSNFVKMHFASVKKDMPAGTPHKEVMSRLAAEYRLQKRAASGQTLENGTQQQRNQQQETAASQAETAHAVQNIIELLSDDEKPQSEPQVATEGVISFLDRLKLAD